MIAVLMRNLQKSPVSLQRSLSQQLVMVQNRERCIVHPIGSAVDYRQLGSKLQSLVGDEEPSPQIVEVIMGRKLQVPLGANGCAYFPFEDLCDRPLEKFYTLALDGVPKFGSSSRTAAYRFPPKYCPLAPEVHLLC